MACNSNTVADTLNMEKTASGSGLDRVQSLRIFADNLPTTTFYDIDHGTRPRDDDKAMGDHTFPDGGFEAWLQVVGGFLIGVNTWFGHMNESQ